MAPAQIYIESELITLLKNKDEKAFNYLYDHYAGALYGVILRVLGSEDRANDVLQEVFVKIWRSIDTYDSSKGRLYTWLLNIARNTAIDILRSRNFRQEQKTTDIDPAVYNKHENRFSVSTNTDQVGLQKAVLALKSDFRVIIDLAYFHGYTQEEIARTLNLPLGTVKTRMRHALMELKTIFR